MDEPIDPPIAPVRTRLLSLLCCSTCHAKNQDAGKRAQAVSSLGGANQAVQKAVYCRRQEVLAQRAPTTLAANMIQEKSPSLVFALSSCLLTLPPIRAGALPHSLPPLEILGATGSMTSTPGPAAALFT